MPRMAEGLSAGVVRFRGRVDGGDLLSWAQGERPLTAPIAAHDALEIAWIHSGHARYRIGRRELDVTAGSAIIVPAGVEHRTTLGAGLRASSTWVTQATVDEIADAMGARPPTDAALVPSPARVFALGGLLQSELERAGRGTEIAARGLLEAVTVEILRGAASEAPSLAATGPRVRDPRVRRALRFIEAAFSEPLTIEQIAREAGMSRFHFSRLFRSELGHPPYQYLLQVRIQRAAELLRAGAGVTETAIRVGLTDPSRFAAAFRRRFGASPAEYARKTSMRGHASSLLAQPA
jgi:AraC-like DNA-binding protein